MYCPMGLENLLGCIFSSLSTQHTLLYLTVGEASHSKFRENKSEVHLIIIKSDPE